MVEKILWQPEFGKAADGRGLRIHLDKDFAVSLVNSQISDKKQVRMNELSHELLEGSKRFKGFEFQRAPYLFHKESALVSAINLGRDCKCISASNTDIESLIDKERLHYNLGYNSHNVDTPIEGYTLSALFGLWIRYAEILVNTDF